MECVRRERLQRCNSRGAINVMHSQYCRQVGNCWFAGWYSYDWLDNLGRKSATRVHEEWQSVQSGDKVPSGPISFTAAIVDAPRYFVLEIRSLGKKNPKLHFTLAYELRDDPQGTRLVTRMRSQIKLPFGRLFEKLILGPGDGIMLRRQLLTISKYASSHNPFTKGER